MTLSNTSIAIVGAGIGGLALAHALHRCGARVTLLEQAAMPGEIGAGLSIWENGLQALESIGLRRAVEARGRRWSTYEIHRPGKPAITRDNTVLSLNGDVSPLMLRRGALFGVLRDALPPGIGIVPSFRVQHIDGTRLIAEDGRIIPADIVVGADGVHSRVRAELTPRTPRFRKQTCFRGIARLPDDDLPTATEIFDARHHRFGCFPLPDGDVYWFDIMDSETPIAPFGDFCGEIKALGPLARRLLDHTPPGTVIASPIEDMPPVTDLHDRIALLGDAVHPMQPSLGQGACIALEDAIVLAGCLRAHGGDYRAGIRAYVSKRKTRWRSLYRLCRDLGTGTLDHVPAGRALAIARMVHTPRWAMAMAGRRMFAFRERDLRF